MTDALQKRNHWKLARISKLVPRIDGTVREAEVYCNKKTLLRPIKQLIPLEIQGNERESQQSATSEAQQLQSPPSNNRYNLRPRKAKHRYPEEQSQNNGNIYGFTTTTKRSQTTWPTTLYLKMALTLVVITFIKGKHLPIEKPKTNQNYPHPNYARECKEQGLYLHAPQAEEYELCVNNYCIREKTPPLHKLLRLPPEEVLHDFEVNWKIRIGDGYTTVETACSALPFCSAIDCTMCAANILNPECWPLAAIAGLGIIIYLLTAICYTLCDIPVTVGRPFRIIIAGIGKVLDLVALFVWCCCQRTTLWVLHRGKQQHPNRILQALAICSLLQGGVACQEVNIFQYHLRNCRTTTGKSTCKVEVASVVKMNPFKKDVCISFQRNNSIVLRTRLLWEGLRLICDRIPVTYTRNVVQKIIDSKRCPHMGSCTGNKCADINTTSILPELAIGNSFPGITGCMESCGGPGCDCFCLSSGCLFYRIYAVPTDDNVYELFKCIRWKEEVKLRLEISKGSTLRTYVLGLHPNIPNQIQSMDVTLSVLATPPLPALEQVFIASTNQTAI
ncbi:hypothetical protein RB195_009405 [Necator americanus]|uniref:Phlebovirus glycoprotein G2 fusion domain-containing protein n=1 Tax=Necator americanus TaxID=51031 RepID=A0ABR1CT71_NECAM